MVPNTETQKMLYRARLQLEEGQYEAALSTLQDIHAESEQEQCDVSYLFGWYYVQSKLWNDAVRVLSPLLQQNGEVGGQETKIERERQALYLLRLGVAAVNLSHYEDASLHFTLCLKVLHDRRIHLPIVRIQARYSLGMTCLMRGVYNVAIQHYEEALRLCRHYVIEDELPNIYYGLCAAYRETGDYIKASLAGLEALQLYRDRGDHVKEAQMHGLLGKISFLLHNFREAADHYTESLALATSFNSPTMVMLDCASLADLRLAEGRMEEAKRYCQLALENMNRVAKPHMLGETYFIVGKVTYGEAQQSQGARRQELLEEALRWFSLANEQLETTQASATRAEVYSAWAQALEDLGRMEEAIECWRSGYEVLSLKKEEFPA
jgi:tetratricopeptide (TPR) repeat protein